MNKLMLVSVAAVLVAGTAAAGEARSQGGSEQRFRSLDRDGNGTISHEEARDKHRVFYYYQRADRNSDGGVDQSEFSAFEQEVPDVTTSPER